MSGNHCYLCVNCSALTACGITTQSNLKLKLAYKNRHGNLIKKINKADVINLLLYKFNNYDSMFHQWLQKNYCSVVQLSVTEYSGWLYFSAKTLFLN